MKILAISQRIEYFNKIDERDCLDHRLVSFFKAWFLVYPLYQFGRG